MTPGSGDHQSQDDHRLDDIWFDTILPVTLWACRSVEGNSAIQRMDRAGTEMAMQPGGLDQPPLHATN